MATTLATKQDLEIISKDLQSLRVEMTQGLQSLRSESRQRCLVVRNEMDLLRRYMYARFDEYELRMTIRMAVLLAVQVAVVFAGMRFFIL